MSPAGGIASYYDDDSAHVDRFVERMEHPQELDGDPRYLLATTDWDLQPYRNPHWLKKAWQEAGTVSGTADLMESSDEAVSRWLHIYGFRERGSNRTGPSSRDQEVPDNLPRGERP